MAIMNDLIYRSAPLQQDSPEVAKLKQNIAACDEALARLRGIETGRGIVHPS
jgi:hypothetical protein